jgi:hypothetical protein
LILGVWRQARKRQASTFRAAIAQQFACSDSVSFSHYDELTDADGIVLHRALAFPSLGWDH